ncbi:hypothetical protein N183_34980 [Sinorhizobium sp. Sb3]|nr:hypothetical protein N183_34980 [Sinorhizobium sp. Sb3]
MKELLRTNFLMWLKNGRGVLGGGSRVNVWMTRLQNLRPTWSQAFLQAPTANWLSGWLKTLRAGFLIILACGVTFLKEHLSIGFHTSWLRITTKSTRTYIL